MEKIIEIPEGHTIEKIGENSYRIVKAKMDMSDFESKYPMELVSLSILKPKLMNKYETFIRLVETCKEWNRIDGFEADWDDFFTVKWCILNDKNRITIDFLRGSSRPLHFEHRSTAELFLNTFREEIELVKDLI